MSLSWTSVARVGLLLLVATLLQLSTFSRMQIFGGYIDLVILVCAATAYLAGSIPGCATGFAAGFLLDLLTGGMLGASSLVLSAIGYGVGRIRELRDPSHGLLPVLVGALATAAWALMFAAVSFMLDVGSALSPLLFREIFMSVILNSLAALPVFAVTARLLRPVLAVDPRQLRSRRRPPRESGPIGLRGLEV